jgi:hypothetical protein
MEQRPFGNDKREVPVIGMGTWYIDNAERTAAIDALRRGIDRGERLNRAIKSNQSPRANYCNYSADPGGESASAPRHWACSRESCASDTLKSSRPVQAQSLFVLL